MTEPDVVADAIVGQVVRCSSAQVFLPAQAARGSLLRGLPNWVQERVRRGIGKTIVESVEAGGLGS